MPLAHHAIFTAYGFWLPNDPRGSCSDFVGAWELALAAGRATRIHTRKSVAHIEHDRAARLRAKEALLYPPVVFSDAQIESVGRGFTRAISESKYEVFACSILPEHVHMVIRDSPRDIEQVIGHLKQRASMSLYKDKLHPFDELKRPDGSAVSCWAERGWSVYLDTRSDIWGAIEYVCNNPIKEGRREQSWGFVRDVPSEYPLTRPHEGAG